MRVGLYAPRKPPTDGGGHTYEEEILQALLLCAAESHHEFVLFTPRQFELPCMAPNVLVISVGEAMASRLRAGLVSAVNRILVDFLDLPTPFRNNGWLDVRMRAEGIEFFWNLNPYTLTTETPYLTVAWDLQHRRQPFFPEVSVDGRFERWTRRFDTLFKRATYVITGTETGRKELELFYQLGEDRVRVIPQPTPSFALSAQVEEIDVLARHKLPARFLYYPAQFWPHKNHVTLLEALNLVRAGGVDIDLVLCGTDQGNLEHVKQSVVRLELTGHVHFLGFVTREELIALYRRAQALTYVSLFGPDNLPPLEAFALGCPVIASRVPGSEEQLGGTALLFEPTDAAALASAIRQVVTDPDERRRLVESGKSRAVRFTGADFVRRVFSMLDEFEPIRKNWSRNRSWRPVYRWNKLFRR